MNIDFYLFQQINNFAGQNLWSDTLAIFFSQYFGYILIFLLILFLIRNFRKYWLMVVQAFIAAILARFVIVEIIRYVLPKPRPFVENHVNLLVDRVNQFAFPSGHAAFFFAIATVVYFYNKKAGILFFLAGFLISISRVFSGIHWPSDILAGALVGILSGYLLIMIFKKTCFLKRFFIK